MIEKFEKFITEKLNNEVLYSLTTYEVKIQYEDYVETIYSGDDKKTADIDFNTLDYSDNDYAYIEVVAELTKFTNKYKFIYDLDEDETIEDYYIKDYYDDSSYYILVDEDVDVEDTKMLEGYDHLCVQLEKETQELLKNKYDRSYGFYNHIDLGEDEDGDSINMTIRIKEHSENPNNRNSGSPSLSIVISNNDETAHRFSSGTELYYNDEHSISDIERGVFDFIQDAITEYEVETLSDILTTAGHSL